jgi:hypothetical protein
MYSRIGLFTLILLFLYDTGIRRFLIRRWGGKVAGKTSGNRQTHRSYAPTLLPGLYLDPHSRTAYGHLMVHGVTLGLTMTTG